MKTLNVSLFLFCFFLLISCGKKGPKPTTLPEMTNEGKNTFGCYVDNTLWLPSNAIEFYSTQLCVKYDASTKSLLLRCWRDNPLTGNKAIDELHILLKDFTATGTYDLTNAAVGGAAIVVQPELHFSSVVTSGSVSIRTFDISKKIISGTFAFTVRNPDGSVIHTATEGRFDLNLDYCL